MLKKICLALSVCSCLSAYAGEDPATPEPIDLDTLMDAVGWNFDTAEIKAETITDDLYVLFGLGGNIGVNVGPDGVFIVDDQFPQLMPKIREAITGLGGEDIDFVVNTHWHFDHAEGNLALGPEGALLLAQENSREMMKEDHVINLVSSAYMQEAYPETAWPDITYTDNMALHLNGQTVSLMHFGPAHTTGDTAVYFEGSDAVHMGDVYNNSGYPFIDVDNGGSFAGVIHFCEEVLKRINENTVVIPGHGPVTDYRSLVGYTEMLKTIHAKMDAMASAGATLEEVYAAKPTAGFDEATGDPTAFINRAYTSVLREK